jgi:hypothetical protein
MVPVHPTQMVEALHGVRGTRALQGDGGLLDLHLQVHV